MMPKCGVALLVSCSKYLATGSDAKLDDLPQAGHSMRRLHAFITRANGAGLHEIEFAPDDIHYVEDPDRNSQITEPLFKLNGTADFMLFYYCGHGVRDSQDKLYFALTNTVKSNPAQVPATAFPVGQHQCVARAAYEHSSEARHLRLLPRRSWTP